MLHPLLRLALDRPDLLADHAGACASLVATCARKTLADCIAEGAALLAKGHLVDEDIGRWGRPGNQVFETIRWQRPMNWVAAPGRRNQINFPVAFLLTANATYSC